MKNTFKISALLIAAFAVSSVSAQAWKRQTRLPSNVNRANDGKGVKNSVNSQKVQTQNTNGKNTNVHFAQPNNNAQSISKPSNVSTVQAPRSTNQSLARPSNVSISNPAQSSSRQAPAQTKKSKTKNSWNPATSGRTRNVPGLRRDRNSRLQKAGTNRSNR